MTNEEIISNLYGKTTLNDDNSIEITTEESLDLSLDAFSINGSAGGRKEWSMVVNNTLCIKNERPIGMSSVDANDKTKVDYVTESETKKDRNRRLLFHHQETYGCPENGRNFKRKSSTFRQVKILQNIKEEDTRDAKYRNKQEVSRRSSANK